MLKSIRELRAIGCFANARATELRFEPLTFIYGENCYGKSTLCEVLRSLSEDHPDYIVNRMTVPNRDNFTQHVNMSFSLSGEERERTYIFDRTRWDAPLPENLKLLVFDSNFIHRNIFTGLSIARGNQENITRFILGEEGTQAASIIASTKAKIREVNKNFGNIENVSFKEIADITSFVRMQVSETLEEIENRVQELTVQLSDQKNLQLNLDAITNRAVPVPITIITGFEGFVAKINDCLGSDFQRVHSSTLERIKHHIEHCTQPRVSTEAWLSQGLELIVNNVCPFCGQEFNGEANELLDMYRNYFDDEFKRFVANASAELEQLEGRFASYQFSDALNVIQQNTIALNQYPELLRNEKVAANISALELKAEGIKDKLEQWQQEFQMIGLSLSKKIEEKKGAIYAATNLLDFTKPAKAFSELNKQCCEYNDCLTVILGDINTFKSSLDQNAITNKIQILQKRITYHNLQRQRLILNNVCTDYIGLACLKQKLESELRVQQKLLEKDQKEFIKNYFEHINGLFADLGSRNFCLAYRLNRRGIMPTLELGASYAGLDITQDKLHVFFSESDKRALALSIFLAKVKSLSPEQRKQTILVLDDPITSFDEGRIDRSLRLMDEMLDEVRQIIVLSHYPTYLKRFFDRVNDTTRGIKLICIRQNESGSCFKDAQIADFVETPQQKKFRHINNFIERRHMEDVSSDLRIFLINEVKSRYYMQIMQDGLDGLQFGELITRLNSTGVINHETYRRLDEFRMSLNPDHHIWTGRSHEDKIALATDVISFIYYGL